jgi:hypothetical protein
MSMDLPNAIELQDDDSEDEDLKERLKQVTLENSLSHWWFTMSDM